MMMRSVNRRKKHLKISTNIALRIEVRTIKLGKKATGNRQQIQQFALKLVHFNGLKLLARSLNSGLLRALGGFSGLLTDKGRENGSPRTSVGG
jgi:hypothetical protein